MALRKILVDQKTAAEMLSISTAKFREIAPVEPVNMPKTEKLKLYLVRELDEWAEGLKNSPGKTRGRGLRHGGDSEAQGT